MNMPISDLIQKAKALHQSYKAQAERDPAGMISQKAADAFNQLLDESKKRCPKSQFIERMQPVASGRTQLAGLLAKVDVLGDSLKAEETP
jgi:hypothetical protein